MASASASGSTGLATGLDFLTYPSVKLPWVSCGLIILRWKGFSSIGLGHVGYGVGLGCILIRSISSVLCDLISFIVAGLRSYKELLVSAFAQYVRYFVYPLDIVNVAMLSPSMLIGTV